jgi:hypothetical protein
VLVVVAIGVDAMLCGSFLVDKKSSKAPFLVSNYHKWGTMGWSMRELNSYENIPT